jgi:hypothetical protein
VGGSVSGGSQEDRGGIEGLHGGADYLGICGMTLPGLTPRFRSSLMMLAALGPRLRSHPRIRTWWALTPQVREGAFVVVAIGAAALRIAWVRLLK